MTDHQDEGRAIAEALRKATDPEGLGRQLRRLWEHAGSPTHSAVARAAGVKSHVTVGQWLKGRTAPRDRDTLRRALDYLGAGEEEKAAAEVAFDAIEDARALPPKPKPKPEPAPKPGPDPKPKPASGLRWDRRRTVVVGVGVAVLASVLAVSQLSGQDSGGKPHAAPSAGGTRTHSDDGRSVFDDRPTHVFRVGGPEAFRCSRAPYRERSHVARDCPAGHRRDANALLRP